jgi:hypothetical protein
MVGQMMNYDVQERIQKDKIARDFIAQVNPYELKPSLGIDLRALSRYAEEQGISIADMSELEINKFSIKQIPQTDNK